MCQVILGKICKHFIWSNLFIVISYKSLPVCFGTGSSYMSSLNKLLVGSWGSTISETSSMDANSEGPLANLILGIS